MVNEEKVNRAIHGMIGREGRLQGGVGENAEPEAVLAEYDRLGGLIRKGGAKVKTGSFYDFDKRTPRKTPDVKLLFRDLEGNEVELSEDEEVPVEVQAAEKIAAGGATGGKKKKKASKKASKEDEEEASDE